ncbi:hypothetical protein B0H10DRAFT_2207248 [Mycena sp. CBHHK59/15]|nr:hypothetical protein B0H10DRAFT_2207248 [Mycena sp. CBHHK59/15]
MPLVGASACPPSFALNPELYALPCANSLSGRRLHTPVAAWLKTHHEFDLPRPAEHIHGAAHFYAESSPTGRAGLYRAQEHPGSGAVDGPYPLLSKFSPGAFENLLASVPVRRNSTLWSPAVLPPRDIETNTAQSPGGWASARCQARAKEKDDEGAKARARAASAVYRANNREELALKQRKVCKQAFIKKHGVHTYIQRHFDAPTPSREVDDDEDDTEDDTDAAQDDHSYDPSAAPLICDYYDPFLKRWHAIGQGPVIEMAVQVSGEVLARQGVTRIAFLIADAHQLLSFELDIAVGWVMNPGMPTTAPPSAITTLSASGGSAVYSPIPRSQTDGCSNSHCKSFKTWADALGYWDEYCTQNHRDGCPPFKTLNFSLTPDNAFPASSSCTHPPRAPAVVPPPVATVSPFRSYTSSVGSNSNCSLSDSECTSPTLATPVSPAPLPEKAPLTPFPKKEEPGSPNPFFTGSRVITMGTRVHLTPAGHAHAAALAPVPLVATDLDAAAHIRRGPTVLTTPHVPDNSPATPPPPALVPPAPVTPGGAPRPSILATPGPGSMAVGGPPACARMAFATAARKLGLVDPKIMVSDNSEKLEAWMTNQPFVGEDDGDALSPSAMARPKSRPARSSSNDASAAPRKKRGNPSDFKGKRMEFMTSQLDAYITASKAKKKKTSEFWRTFFARYW